MNNFLFVRQSGMLFAWIHVKPSFHSSGWDPILTIPNPVVISDLYAFSSLVCWDYWKFGSTWNINIMDFNCCYSLFVGIEFGIKFGFQFCIITLLELKLV